MSYHGAMSEQQPAFITIDELALVLRVHRRTVQRYLAAGTITPDVKIGRCCRFSLENVLKQLSAQPTS